jgi:hypothetical protein
LTELRVEGSPQRRQYGAFAAGNAAFVRLTGQRVVSCWDCYYRRDYPDLADYPGFQLLAGVEDAAGEIAAG